MKTFLKEFSIYIKFLVIFILVVSAASVDYYYFYNRTNKIEILETLNDKFDTVRVSIIKLEYTLDMFIVARRFEETTVALIKHDILQIDTELEDIITDPKFFPLINDNIMLSDGLVSVVEDWQIVKSEISSLNEASTRAEVMLIHNAVDLKTILIQEVSDRLVQTIIKTRNQALLETRTHALWTIGGFVSVILIGFFFLYKRVLSQAREASTTARLIKSTESGTRFTEGKGIIAPLMSSLNFMLETLKKDGKNKLSEIKKSEVKALGSATQVNALMALNRIAASSLSQDEVFEAGVQQVVKCSASGAALVYINDEHGLRLKASHGMNKTFSMDGAIIPQFIKNLRTGKEETAVIYDSVDGFPNKRFGALVKANGFGAMVSVPIQFSGTLYGYIYAAYIDKAAICTQELPFLEAVSSIFGTYTGYITRFRSEYDVNNFLDMLLNQLPFGIAVYDKSGVCRLMNTTHKKFLGVRDNEALVGRFRVFEDDVLLKQGMVTSIKKSYEGYATEFIITYDPGSLKRFHFNGQVKTLRIKSIPLYDSGGEISNIALLYDDVTDIEESIGGSR